MSEFISCDWGTSNLRLRLVNADDKTVLKEIKTGEGIASIYRSWKAVKTDIDRADFYLSVLKKQIDSWEEDELRTPFKNIPVLISGMASSSIGLTELEYKTLPVEANGSGLLIKKIDGTKTFFNPVFVVSGVCTENDVMRGEETLLAGCDTLPGKTELFIIPGTHSKHILVSDGNAESITTYMTGEFFELLSKQSILSSSLLQEQEFKTIFFEKGIRDGASMNLLNSAFRVRVNHLFKRVEPGENFHYLSGLLIGAELREIKANNLERITVVASDNLVDKYISGLQVLGLSPKTGSVDAAQAIVRGHCKIFSFLKSIESG